MKTDRLVACLAKYADSQETIQAVRKAIVGLAVAGKLDGESQSQFADALGETIGGLGRPTRTTEAKANGLVNQIDTIDVPHPSLKPDRFVSLGQIAKIYKGKTGIKQALPGPYPLVVTASDRSACDHYDFDGAAAIIPLVSSTGHGKASLHRLHYQEGKFALGSILAAVFPKSRELISARFIFEYLSAFKEELLVSQMIGTANVSLSVKKISEVPVPLVSRMAQNTVDELMTLCDSLEAEREKREAIRDRLTMASLSRLTAPAVDERQFKAHADFAIKVLPELTTRPDQIKVLRQTILDLAVRGKLVTQDPNDEPAIVTLEKAKVAKGRLMEARGIRREADLDLSKSDGETCSPAHWAWAHLGDFALVQGGKRLPAGASFSPEKTGNIYIRVSDMKGGTIAIEGLRHISEEVREKISKYTIDKEDVFITIAGTIGEVGVIPRELDGQNLTENAAKIIFRGIDQRFLVMVLGSIDVQGQITEKTKQMAQPKLALKRISGLRLPVPPLSEQRRIVERVDFLVNLCGELIQRLEIEVARRGQLLEQMIRMPLRLDAHF